ncbi:hypothetical protein [Aestuariibaculum marinum]|uniref:Uncharacterized protein n=1 Tax=Aestuariibaculum marinum TaxID=2683592 RepID=A0A8J6PYK6_9FLAO|nr:hypothetical protein [Aestuariibaculum marinum]MBD0824431.1 hypothetical protein [Aestuariibaculum marinum]
MLRHFPEIVQFFKQDTFSEDDLTVLKQQLAETYPDAKVYKQAVTLIELFLVKFELSTPRELQRFKNAKGKSKSKQNGPTLATQTKAKKVQQSKPQSYGSPKSLRNLKGLPAYRICKQLELSFGSINRCLAKNEVFKIESEEDTLSEVQFEALREMFLSRQKGLRRMKSPGKPIPGRSASKRSNDGATGVYGEIQRRGGLGKVIYIRKR